MSRPREFYAARDRLIVRLLASSGMRVSEVCQVNVESLNLREWDIELPYSKNGEPRWKDISGAMRGMKAYLLFHGAFQLDRQYLSNILTQVEQ